MDLTPAVNGRYGAPMGRRGWNDNAEPYTGRMYLRHIRLDGGGYDPGGAYWGTREPGERLYGYAAVDNSANGFIDAKDRMDARAQVRAKYPGATFYR